jgi:hypothetical protein
MEFFPQEKAKDSAATAKLGTRKGNTEKINLPATS